MEHKLLGLSLIGKVNDRLADEVHRRHFRAPPLHIRGVTKMDGFDQDCGHKIPCVSRTRSAVTANSACTMYADRQPAASSLIN
ncbi:hypothetical protein KC367_g177 [Hortaea werneckii]|nr:hypothetical protein KC367_g177 [Hortaea werneckii]